MSQDFTDSAVGSTPLRTFTNEFVQQRKKYFTLYLKSEILKVDAGMPAPRG